MKPNRSLVNKAKTMRRKMKIVTSPAERELALAWMRGEVNLTQASRALNPDKPVTGNTLYRFAVCFRDEYLAGRIKLVA